MHTSLIMRFNRRTLLLAAAAIVFVAAYVGDISEAGIQGSGRYRTAAIGRVTGFGSVFVNGVEYDTSGAAIRVNDQPATEAQLRVGQVVTLTAETNADGSGATALDLAFNGNVVGPVASVDTLGKSVSILGQRVRITQDTAFGAGIQPASLAGLQPGVVLEVSGFPNSFGDVVASRIDKRTAGAIFQVAGAVQALDAGNYTFQINSLTVDYSATAPEGTLASGVIALVQGELVSGGVFRVSRVQVVPAIGVPGERGEITGLITTLRSSSDFNIGGQRVIVTPLTQLLLHGLGLLLNVEVVAKGTFDETGTLVATRIEVLSTVVSVLRGIVNTVTGSVLSLLGLNAAEVQGRANVFANGTLSVLGVKVVSDSQTRFAGFGNGAAGAAAFAAQAANRGVNVRGTYSGGVLTADDVRFVD